MGNAAPAGRGSNQAEPLVEYARAPNPSTVLVVTVPQLLVPSHWLVKAVPAGGIVEIPQLTGRALGRWLRSRASDDGVELEEEAAQLLITLVGDDPAALSSEVGKAALAGPRTGASERPRCARWWASTAPTRSSS